MKREKANLLGLRPFRAAIREFFIDNGKAVGIIVRHCQKLKHVEQ